MAQNKNYKETMQATPYFQSLPVYLQETVKQTSLQIENEEDLKRFVSQISRGVSF